MIFNLKTLALAAGLALASQAASAASFNFSGVVDFSPTASKLVGEFIAGQFSYDDQAALLAGPDGTVALQSLDLSFLGQTFHLAPGSDAYAQFEGGALVGPNAGFAGVAGGYLQLLSVWGSSGFSYSHHGADSLGSLTVSAVPEPSTWALSLVGLLGLGALARRRAQLG
ncbi:PEP-CTERM sorting domain-containing protein [Paucibacter sp. TC2R-5]|uniref:PEP-CTERM sorting domain-containing protein n=1 Tax=Paucibacter sp. TC2R-5 TaxID=2893555 RepID=UPI0021E4236D|nr:PEP-CTERM sorting domain-containing protein [Paucibacter sp. TC2R-5]MCV2360344.1 PEP-CTERM sorting domain-containing protein [Paucibacter sp. TC2R-5]